MTATQTLAADEVGLARAAQLLGTGEQVAVPTETVYGLAARADSEAAVAGIYRAKGRPSFNPLIVHVSGMAMARRLAHFDASAQLLAERYWPGPLTLVLPVHPDSVVVPAVTAGLPTIALRMPDHPVAMALLQQLGLPLAAPSANRSESVSPTAVSHVLDSLGGRIAAIIDGGACAQGLESTIVAPRKHGWSLLREGPVTREELSDLLGSEPEEHSSGAIESPGQLARHYSPGKPMRLDAVDARSGEFLIGFGPVAGDCTLSSGGDLAEAAARLYACLHLAAGSRCPRIAVAPIPHQGIGAAINDRLRRAAR